MLTILLALAFTPAFDDSIQCYFRANYHWTTAQISDADRMIRRRNR